jgi:uncharacterized protein YceK
MPALPLLIVLLLAGCVPVRARSDGVPTSDAPFTLTALDLNQTAVLIRWRTGGQRAGVVRAG